LQSLLIIDKEDNGHRHLRKTSSQKSPYCTGVEALKTIADQRENIRKYLFYYPSSKIIKK